MDTKLKNNNRQMNKYVAGLLVAVFCALAAFGMCKSYGLIEKAAADRDYNYFETSEFQSSILCYSYGLAYDFMSRTESGEAKTPAELLINQNGVERDLYVDEEYRKDEATEFNDAIYGWITTLTTLDNRNLKYYAQYGDITTGNEDTLTLNNIDAEQYQMIIMLEFDSTGYLNVTNIKGAEYIAFTGSGYESWMDYSVQPIKDMSIVFAVPNELISGDIIALRMENESSYRYAEIAVCTALLFLAILFFLGLLLPYEWFSGFGVLRIPVGLWIVTAAFAISGLAFMCEYVVGKTIQNNSITVGELVISDKVILLGNFIGWIAIFIFTFLGTIEFKSLFKLGIKRFIRRRTIVGRVYGATKRGGKRILSDIEKIDLRDNNNSYILKLLGVNAIILLVISSLWVAGIPVIIVYSIVLYFIIRKYVDVISSKYRILTEATNQIADGNLDVTIKEDLGVFNPFKDNLEKIQGGFKKAVEEEVKSQKMKTDLISNVSHDLKTPLTAIITYVDLLRDVSLPEEKRKEYVEILDRKAQRLQVLIEDLFEMSKATSGTLNLQMEEVDIVALMKQTIVEVGDRLEEADLTVKTSYSSEKLMVSLDSERMYRVFENLLLNASKYALNHTRVFVDIAEKEGYVEIAVKNVSAEEINFTPTEIVERFVRGDKSRNTEGSGLGLAIAKSFVELQGGKFQIEIDGDLFKAIILLNA